ncbi:unnamed protein product [Urochloa humidicola]
MAGEDELLAGGGVPIRPPRLEDAGLEDCALPPESIAEAFSLAAAAVSSRLARFPLSDDEEGEDEEEGRSPAPRGGGCVDDAVPARGAVPGADALVDGGEVTGGGADAVVVVGGGRGGGGCEDAVVVGGRGGGGCEDAVVVGGRGEAKDEVVVVGDGRGETKLGKDDGRVEAVREGVSDPRRVQGDGEGREEAAEKAILVPDFD